MYRRIVCLIALLPVLCLAASTNARLQEGHPLTGTWSGDWGPTLTQRTRLTVVLNWDGDKVTGILNPGPDAVPITSVFVDVTNWTVRLEADVKSKGATEHVSAEGRLEDIGSYHRTLAGTWKQGSVAGDFRLTRE